MKKTFYNSPLGQITILADDQAIYGLWFDDQKHFGGQNPRLDGIVLNPRTTEFQKKVYHALLKMPYGKTITYKELSDLIQSGYPRKNLSRAVGNAIGRNQILLIIPCHRVIGSNGSLTGYAGGLARKKELLKLEGALKNE